MQFSLIWVEVQKYNDLKQELYHNKLEVDGLQRNEWEHLIIIDTLSSAYHA
jgi:hypothetical protein